ncbi:hypothetical protein HCN44_010846 [Aphidius gifuensis]|uniref:Transcription initiation factor IIE subunit alpha N-terminal domain-containing protein n=1 Tax=Aphidius gifuensis TaxID=684658 RepID=A0A834Y8P0_APHGI|nr:hypothetical protein HCN44_010846 [Aphidius gifuensis]
MNGAEKIQAIRMGLKKIEAIRMGSKKIESIREGFVNVVKYKLNMISKRLETEERDSTSRASFKCTECFETFTDFEADQLFDPMTGEFRCTSCNSVVT